MVSGERFTPKSERQLEEQARKVSGTLDHEIVQPFRAGEIMRMPLDEIKRQFPVRYEMYLKTLKAEKRDKPLDPEEKEQMVEYLEMLNNLDLYIALHKSDEQEQTLRERQLTVFEDLRNFLEEGGKEGYIKLPTGAGKTVVFSEFIEAAGLKTLVVVPTQILVEQTKEKLTQFAGDVDVGRIYAGAKEQGRQVTVTTYQSLVSQLERGEINPREYKCLVLDEAHTALTEKRTDAIQKFDEAIKLGFTATPKYSEDKQVSNLLNTEIHNLGIREAVEENILAPFSVILAQTNIDLSGVNVQASGEYSERELERAVNVAGRNKSAVELYQKMFAGERAIAYCTSVAHADAVVALFNEEHIAAATISGKTPIAQQLELKDRFSRGEIQILCNADILIPGFDEPSASVCLNLRPTRSAVIAEQRGGRVLRLDPENIHKHATIVEVLDRNANKKAMPITFAEIVDGAYIVPKSSGGGSGGGGGVDVVPKPEITIDGLKVITGTDEVMRIVREMVEQKAEPAPEGWMTKTTLVEKMRSSKPKINQIIDQYREEKPGWFGFFLGNNKQLSEFFSPELLEEIIEGAMYSAPNGWFAIKPLAHDIGRSQSYTKEITGLYRTEHPDWFKMYKKGGNKYEYLSPELVKEVKLRLAEEESKFSDVLHGWMSANGLVEVRGKGTGRTIKKIADPFRKTHPDWFRNFRDKGGRVYEYYSPELVTEIKKRLGME